MAGTRGPRSFFCGGSYETINAGDDGRYHYALWNAKVHAVVPGPWHLPNPEGFMSWGSGSSYLRPSSGIPPRIVRFGLKVDW